MSVNDQEHPGPIAICIRGDAHNRGEAVPRGFIAIVGPHRRTIGPDVSGRAQLAEWLTSDRNPLTSRVAVNRVWQHLFGQGLVGTPDDFGTRGDRPSHPELLDHLARQFMRQGWSVKRLIRDLVLSRTYRLSSNFDRAAAARDPENRWLWRMNRRRLQVEALRDGLLAVSGQLDRSPTESVVADLSVQATGVGVKPNKPVRSVRRTIYLPVVRNDLPALFQLFDFGDALSVNGRRSTTNVAPQALFMMNSPLVLEAADRTAASVLAGGDVSDERQVLERFTCVSWDVRRARRDRALAGAGPCGPVGVVVAAGRRVGEGPGVGGPRPARCSVRRASSISIEGGRMFGSQPIGISRRRSSRTPPVGSDTWLSRGSLQAAAAEPNPLAAKVPHLPARAKRVIFMFMHGGPSQVDTFDYKPTLAKYSGQPAPFVKADADAPRKKKTPLLRPCPWKFAQYGQSGRWVSELFPHVARHVDDLCVINSMYTEGRAHGEATLRLHTGTASFVRPSLGSWVTYGLGTENSNLPGFITIAPPRAHGGVQNYSSAFLPAIYQGTAIGTADVPVEDASIPFLSNDKLSPAMQRRQLDLIQRLNLSHLRRSEDNAQIEGMVQSYELAFRMQSAAPSVLELAGESEATRRLYGIGTRETDDFGRQCLLARRFAEAGVRFIQISTGYLWDQHEKLVSGHEKIARAVDRPIAGLLTDLKARGLLEDTLVFWGAEFGRTPYTEGIDGRDHNPEGYSVWLAGGGVKAGIAYGRTDEFGFAAVEDKVHYHDLHATILYLLGLDHERLTYRYSGRDFRLTDVYGRVVHDILA